MKRLGRIKSGEGTLIGNAGEHYVMAELLRRGIVAGLTPRNATGFDILATWKGQHANVRVKTKSSDAANGWRWNADKDGNVFKELVEGRHDFTVLVDLGANFQGTEFFVIPTGVLDQWIKEDFKQWLSAPGIRVARHNPENKVRVLRRSKIEPLLLEYKDNFGSLFNGFGKSAQ